MDRGEWRTQYIPSSEKVSIKSRKKSPGAVDSIKLVQAAGKTPLTNNEN